MMECISDFSCWENIIAKLAPIATASIALIAALIALGAIFIQMHLARRRASIDFFLKTEIDEKAIDLYDKFRTHAPSMSSIPPVGQRDEYKDVRSWLMSHTLSWRSWRRNGLRKLRNSERQCRPKGWREPMTRYAVAILLALTMPAGAEDIASANYMLPACKSFANDENARTHSDAMKKGRCVGVVEGLGYTENFCQPKGSTVGQAVAVVVKYIEARPERMHEDFGLLALEALTAAWPCKIPVPRQ
jgi:Rap1a immunity proteins